MATLISLRAYARHRKELGLAGGTLAAIQRAATSNRITLTNGKIDAAVADLQWAAHTDTTRRPLTPDPGPTPVPGAPEPGNETEPGLRKRLLRARVHLLERDARAETGERTTLAAVGRAIDVWHQLAVPVGHLISGHFHYKIRPLVPADKRDGAFEGLDELERTVVWRLLAAFFMAMGKEHRDWALNFAQQFAANKGGLLEIDGVTAEELGMADDEAK